MEYDIRMREDIEWLNYWIEDANCKEKKRILVIGDSVARGYVRALSEMLKKNQYVIDYLTMSYSVFDLACLEEIEHFVSKVGHWYKYEYILFNLGAHHGYSLSCKENREVCTEYKKRLGFIFDILEKMNCSIHIISGTLENTQDVDSHNAEIERRNQVLKLVSMEYGFQFIDLYTMLSSQNFEMPDQCHYFGDGYEYMAGVICRALGL